MLEPYPGDKTAFIYMMYKSTTNDLFDICWLHVLPTWGIKVFATLVTMYQGQKNEGVGEGWTTWLLFNTCNHFFKNKRWHKIARARNTLHKMPLFLNSTVKIQSNARLQLYLLLSTIFSFTVCFTDIKHAHSQTNFLTDQKKIVNNICHC